MKFPNKIYIQNDPNAQKDEFSPIAWESIDQADDGRAAIYELKEVVRKSTQTIIKKSK